MSENLDYRPTLLQIITHLGPAWTPAPDGNPEEPDSLYNRTHLLAKNGNLTILLYHTGNTVWPKSERNRLKASAIYPTYKDRTPATLPDDPITITMSLSKTPRVIAQDITTRLLPHYTARIESVMNRIKSETIRHNHKRATEELIAVALGTAVQENGNGMRWIEPLPYSYRANLPHIELTAQERGQIDAKIINLDADTAIQIARIVQQSHKWQTQKAQANT